MTFWVITGLMSVFHYAAHSTRACTISILPTTVSPVPRTADIWAQGKDLLSKKEIGKTILLFFRNIKVIYVI